MKREDKVFPIYSRKEVKKAGIILLDDNCEDRTWALDVLNNWRACHSYPVNTFQAYLRLKIKTHAYKNYIVVQRIKRTPSIIGKLKRYPEMQLSRMHDIGGMRYCQMLWIKKVRNPPIYATSPMKFPSLQKTP